MFGTFDKLIKPKTLPLEAPVFSDEVGVHDISTTRNRGTTPIRCWIQIPPPLTEFALHSSSVGALMGHVIPGLVPVSAGARRLVKLKFESEANESDSK